MGIVKKGLIVLCLIFLCAVPVSAEDYTAPDEPSHVSPLLPEDRDSFGEGLVYVFKTALGYLQPSLIEAAGTSFSLIGAVMLISLVKSQEGKQKEVIQFVAVVGIACLLLQPTKAMVHTASETITEISEYGKLLLPVMTAALSAQGGMVTSAALYTATVVFDAALMALIRNILVPMVYIYMILSIVHGAVGDAMLKKLRDLMKQIMTWSLKIVLYVFTGYISITGVVSGTTDQTSLKAVKMTISGMVPVVGSILSDASEAVLISAGLVKNAVGISGMLVIIGIAIVPFLQIAMQYLLLKLTAAVCALFADKSVTELMEDFTGAMGFLLGMTGAVCMIFLISMVCFLKGVG